MRIILIFFIAITIKAQFVLTSGNYRHETVSIGDTNSTFSDTTTVGDWELVGNDTLYVDGDSTLLYSNVPQELNPNPYFDDWTGYDSTNAIGANINVTVPSAWTEGGTITDDGNAVTFAPSASNFIYKGSFATVGVYWIVSVWASSTVNGDVIDVYTGSSTDDKALGYRDVTLTTTPTRYNMLCYDASATTGYIQGRSGTGTVSVDSIAIGRALFAPDGWTASTMDADNYVIEDDDGLYWINDGTYKSLTIASLLTVGKTYSYSITVESLTGSFVLGDNSFDDIVISSTGTTAGTWVADNTSLQLKRNTAFEAVISELSIKEYHATNNIELPLASVDGQDYRATMQMMEYDGTVAPQPIISYGTKSLTYTALSSDWQTYTFDFEGEVVNNYYSFDGVDDVITVADDASLRVGENDYSLEWYGKINANNSAGYGSFLIGKGINAQSFGLCLYGDLIAFAHRGDVSSYATFSHNLGEYYHFVMTKTSIYIYLFIDGVKTDSVSISGNTYTESNEAFKIGQNSFSGSSTYGNIDTKLAKLYNKALSQSEITTLYNNRNSTSATTVTDSLVLDLNGIDGNLDATTWSDQSGNSNDGTVSGATFKQPPYLEISLSDTSKVKIDNVTITR